MGGCATHHPLITVKIAVGVLAATLLVGCATPSGRGAQLNAARGDRAAFGTHFATAATADSWFQAVSLGAAEFADTDTADTIEVRTRFVGDRRSAGERLALVLDQTGAIIGTRDNGVRPVWALDAPVTITTMARGTLIFSDVDAAAQETWASRLEKAVTVVAAAEIAEDWQPGLVVEMPQSEAGFVAAAGIPAAGTAALTTCASGTPRVVINPQALSQSARWLQTTLTHEAVHVATDSACLRGTAWVVEGVAESVAAASDPQTAADNAALIGRYVAKHHPRELPRTVASQTDYALAQLAVDELRAHLSSAEARAVIARGVAGELTDRDVARATAWYLAALERARG